ncbi:deoxyribose-phosphate aldolase [Holophaga foetida]|uniref:deoxyribose-phosphate aldolase n=1 Tax=Holophaga foetida TaxID=35839 RepID=UPI0002473EEC|nr:deoxyribose-phosphate aldolase [Holophaga foetida]
MSSNLCTLASEILKRMEGRPLPQGVPQFLACDGEQCLLRTGKGFQELPLADLPPRPDIAHLLDHTLLRATATEGEIDQLCREALEHGFASVCVNPVWVKRSASLLEGSAIGVCTVIGFPLGANTLSTKAREAEDALAQGAREIDFVMALGYAKSAEWRAVETEFRELRRVTGSACLKVILETCLLEDEEKRLACRLAREEGLDFVKTSTGFSTGGATPGDVMLLRQAVGTDCGVKASGGIRTHEAAMRMLLAGATRLGVSASLAMLSTCQESPY